MKSILFSALLVAATMLVACAPSNLGPDDAVVGTWRDSNQEISLASNGNFSQSFYRMQGREAARRGDTTVRVDSLYGTYQVESIRKNLIFTGKGYRERLFINEVLVKTNMVRREYNVGIWNFKVSGNKMDVTTPTSLFTLTRQ